MIIHLDWFGCNPRSKWETEIHQTLENLATIKRVSRASVRVEEITEGGPRSHLTMMLTMPGPDVISHGIGHTFDEALLKLTATVRQMLTMRAMKLRQHDGAARGVKALHRG
jgi:hypothetical protein